MGEDLSANAHAVPDHAARLCVLQLVPRLDEGGVERGTIEIAAALHAAGGRALVASAGGRLEAALQRAGGELIRLPAMASKAPWTLPWTIAALRRLIVAERVALVHARSRAPAWAGFFAARAEGCAFVTTYHGIYRENLPLKRRYNAVMAKGRPVIAISEHVAALVRARHGVAAEDIVTIPRGADPGLFDPALVTAQRRVALVQAWGLGDDPRPIVLLPGRLTRWKGQLALIAAAARLPRTPALPVRLVMAGGDPGGAFAREILAAADRAGLARDISLVGPVADMPAALALAAVVVCPSLEPEAFGRTVVEAQAMGRPVIASAHGGAMETVAHGHTGWLVPPGDAAALADAIAAALSAEPSRLARMGAEARASVVARFSVAAMQAATLATYRRRLGLPAPGETRP